MKITRHKIYSTVIIIVKGARLPQINLHEKKKQKTKQKKNMK